MNDDAQRDEGLLIDLLFGELSEEQRRQVDPRLENDKAFARRRDELAGLARVYDRAGDVEPPADLVERTLQSVRAARQTDALLSRQSRSARPATFSFRELAAIAAVLIVMAGVLLPSLQLARHRSRRGLCAAGLGEIGSALQTFAINHDNTLPHHKAGPTHWLPREGPRASNSEPLFTLLREGYLSPVVFQCPAVGGSSFTMREDLRDFPEPGHIQYSYNYSLNGHGLSILDPQLVEVGGQMAILADQTPLFSAGRYHPEELENLGSDNHGRRGQNVLYLDGHVHWATTAHAGVRGDNIYLVADARDYDGDEHPAGPTDTFLLPAHPEK